MNRIILAFLWTGLVVASAQAQVPAGRGAVAANAQSAWWTDTALMARLGLTEQQKLRIESSFQAYRQSLISARETLEKEEALLARLLDADNVERSAVLPQVNKVIQARSDMERLNATMTVEMREQLTRAQWAQLQGQPSGARGGRGGRATGLGGPEGAAPDSFAAKYAADKPVTLDGRVIEFKFIDPHSFIIFEAVGSDGRIRSWTGELGSSTGLARQGWTATTLKPGDRITVQGSEAHDASLNAVNIRTVRRVQ